MRKQKLILLIACLGLLLTQFSYAITAKALKRKLNQGEDITVIDVRLNAIYQQGHIHNAINIPASIIEHKKLPQLGDVVIYGDGIDDEGVDEAVMHLNEKPGINAEVLKGGFSAWSAKNSTVQRKSGLSPNQTKNITYKKLQKMVLKGKSVILVDLRVGTAQESLAEHFPNVRIHDPISSSQEDILGANVTSEILAGIPKRNRNVLVLIDDGDGVSETVANKLHAAGVKRLAILSGGEQALQARGESSETVHKSGG